MSGGVPLADAQAARPSHMIDDEGVQGTATESAA
jgi:hypothetical protein